ncbi:MAG: tyrosine-type recombinase/integrase [Candidatus Entotheonellia bacterium]
MAVFKKQGVYWIDYYVNGRRKRERIGPDKKLAETVLKKRKVEIAEGKYLDKRTIPRCTVAELGRLYLEWARVNHRGYASTRSRVEHLRDTFGPLQLRELTPMVIDAYVSQRTTIRTSATVNREVQILHHMFVKALEWGKALENPIRHQKRLRVNNRRLRYLSQEEITRLFSAADDFLRPIVLAALHTGLRRGALLALTWQDIDLQQGVIRVAQTKNGERLELPMTETLRITLQQLPRRLASDYVFPGKTGQGLVDIRKRFHRALREAGIERFVFHDLRHTFASHLVMAGVDLLTVKEFLGHKDIKMTLRYAHLAPDYKKSAISRLDTSMDTRHEKGATA